MDTTNLRADQARTQARTPQQPIHASATAGATPATGDWKTQFHPLSRQRIVIRIVDVLKNLYPSLVEEATLELKTIAVRLEEKFYTTSTSQQEYLRNLGQKLLTIETKSRAPAGNALQPNPGTSNQNAADSVSGDIQTRVHNQNQQLPIPIIGTQSQARQQLLPQNIQNNTTSTGMQNSASITTAPASVDGMTHSLPNANGQSSSLQSMQNISNVAQSSMANSMGQGMPSNMSANNQRPMPGRQQQAVSQQSQQQSQNPRHFLDQKFTQGSMSQSPVQPHMQRQQQQQYLSQQSQHSLMQSTMRLQNQQSSTQQSAQTLLPQHSQHSRQQHQQHHSQQSSMMHPQTSLAQQPILASQQQQPQTVGPPPRGTNIQQNQMLSQPNSIREMQQHSSQSRRMSVEQSNLSNLQQHQLLDQHQQQISKQNNANLIHQPQTIGLESNNAGMPGSRQNDHMLQQSRVTTQQPLQQSAGLVQPQGQQSQQMQLPQQQLMSQIQSQPAQLQQQIGYLQQPKNTLQREMQTSTPLLHHQNGVDPQKQLLKLQREIPHGPSTSLGSTSQRGSVHGGDWQEEVYQKIRSMKEMYFVELNGYYQKLASKIEQHEIPQQPEHPHFKKILFMKAMLAKILQFLRLNKNDIQITHKDQTGQYEKRIVDILKANRHRNPNSSMSQGQLTQCRMHVMQQHQLSGSQISQMQPHDSQLSSQMQSSINTQGSVVPLQNQLSEARISQMQPHESHVSSQMQSSMNIQGSVVPKQKNNLANVQHNSLPSPSSISNPEQSLVNSLHSGSCLDATQSNSQNSLQQVEIGSIRQNPVRDSQQMNLNPIASQSGMNSMQSNLNPLQQNSNMIQHQQLNQNQQLIQRQPLKQLQPQQLQQQQFLHRQSALLQQQKPTQLPSHNLSQIHQMNEMNDLEMLQQMGVKSGISQQHHPAGQRAYHHPQLKAGNLFISSPSPQAPQHLSPQSDQQNMPTLIPKAGTHLQSLSSPFIGSSPSTPLAPSPMLMETEKLNTGVSPLSHTGAIGHQEETVPSAPAQFLAIDSPGISASPLLAEFTIPDGTHGVGDGNSTAVEQPYERLMRGMKSISSKALIAAVSDISSVVTMVDRVAGAAPGNGSRAAVCKDLVSSANCPKHARDFTQEGEPASKKMRRYTSVTPSIVFSSASNVHDSFRPVNCSEASDLESMEISCVKQPQVDSERALIEEILEINRRLIDTTIEICNEGINPSAVAITSEDGEGTIVKCSYNAVALGQNFKALYASAQMAPIQPLTLLVPNNYPHCSPILLDKFPVESSAEFDLSMKVKSKFSLSLRCLPQPVSLSEVARTWDGCVRVVVMEYAQQTGGGTFSSKFGTWENCLIAT